MQFILKTSSFKLLHILAFLPQSLCVHFIFLLNIHFFTGRTQSPSLHSWGSAKSLTGSVCQHRRHTRLDNLRTLILADNELDRLILLLDDDDFEEEDSKSSESFEAIDATGKVSVNFLLRLL